MVFFEDVFKTFGICQFLRDTVFAYLVEVNPSKDTASLAFIKKIELLSKVVYSKLINSLEVSYSKNLYRTKIDTVAPSDLMYTFGAFINDIADYYRSYESKIHITIFSNFNTYRNVKSGKLGSDEKFLPYLNSFLKNELHSRVILDWGIVDQQFIPDGVIWPEVNVRCAITSILNEYRFNSYSEWQL